MENNLENKARFFALYYGQKICIHNNWTSRNADVLNTMRLARCENYYLEPTPLSSITDEDAIELGRIVFERPKAEFTVERREYIMYLNYTDKLGIKYYASMLFDYATINTNVHIPSNDNDSKYHTFKQNIGEIQLSSERPLAYIMIVDYLRRKGYAIPFMGMSVKKMIEYGWIKPKTK